MRRAISAVRPPRERWWRISAGTSQWWVLCPVGPLGSSSLSSAVRGVGSNGTGRPTVAHPGRRPSR
jgi:hypothetical protein